MIAFVIAAAAAVGVAFGSGIIIGASLRGGRTWPHA